MPLPLPVSRARRPDAGFGLIESLIGVSVLAMAMLAYISTTLSHQRLAEDAAARTQVHQVARELLERMRGDPEWSTLYERVRALQIRASVAGLSGERLNDGRLGFPPGEYYPDMVVPRSLGSLVLLVDAPHAPDDAGVQILREDVTAPKFSLPADLNGDGKIDDAARDEDYVALPVIVTVRWTPNGESAREMRLSTGLRGER